MVEKKNKEQVQFLPWAAINAFMVPEYQHQVMHEVLNGYDGLESEQRRSLNQMIKKGAKLNGFRNATMAPLSLRINAAVGLFEKHAAFTAEVLAAWCTIHADLAQKVYDLLVGRGWEILPLDADRKKLPGFLTRWPKKDEYEVLIAAYREQYGEDAQQASDNDISLMSVWLSGRLPYELVEEEEEPADEGKVE
ncbi:MAG: hypothetical protein JW750_00475 [Anaerolineaceae bacterium]|nr:hypothetical protein [Anaerolineaceae bacterium]